MNPPARQISKYGGLQTRKRKKGGTLIRKAKYIFEAEQWVALCVHRQQIPLLEWYSTANEILSHQPIKVLDLLECLYVEITVGDDRCFNIGFVDEKRPVIEFAARSTEEAREWVKEIKKCLRELNCLQESSNEYQAMPIQQRPDDDNYESLTPGLIRADPSPPPQPSPIRNRAFYHLNAEIPLPTSPAPALPPRPGQQQQQPPPQSPQQQKNHATSAPIRIPSPEMKFNEEFSPPPSPTDSPPLSPRLLGAIAKSPTRRSTKISVSSIPDEELPPRLPPRRGPSELSTSVPLSPSLELRTTIESSIGHRRSNGGSSNSRNGGGGVVTRYDYPLSPPPTVTSPGRTSMNGNICHSPTSPSTTSTTTTTKFRPPKVSGKPKQQLPTSPSMPAAATAASTMSAMAAAVAKINETQYDRLPSTPVVPPPPPPPLSPSAYEIPTSSSNTLKKGSNNNIYNSPGNQQQPIYTKFTFPTDSSVASTSDESDYRRLSNEMTQLRMSLISSSTEDSNESTKSQPNDYYSPAIPPRPPKLNALSANSLNYAGSFREKKAVTKEISLLLSICLESLLLVEVAGSVWIAGWSESQNASLCDKLHVGDQLVEVDGILVKSIKQFPDIFHNHSLPGQPIPLKIRTLPHGITYLITKPFNVYTPRTFGIILHKKKNRIEEIISHTPAAKAGILPRQQPFLWGRDFVSSVITEVNGIPLNPFSTNEQFYKRIEKLANGSEIQLVVQPYDLCKLFKQQLKGIKNLKHYLQN